MRFRFSLFQRYYLPDVGVNETVAMVRELIDLCTPGAIDEIPPVVMNCSCIQVNIFTGAIFVVL